MEEAILNFHKQFEYEPVIENSDKMEKKYKHYVLAGMGGSHLASGLLKMHSPGVELYVHRDYGLPPYSDEFFKESLLIASSYSGNTEEIIDFLEEGYSKGYNMAVIATGGKLIDFAKENSLPYIQMPEVGIQPRAALGYSLTAIATLTAQTNALKEMKELPTTLNPESFRQRGEELAKELDGKIPVIYSSNHNLWIAYNWKIKLNETGKVPAVYNVFPELNHNELNGFYLSEGTEKFRDLFHFIILRDVENDHPRVQKRMAVVEGILEGDGRSVTTLGIEGNNSFERIFSSLLLADWTAVSIAKKNNVDPEQVPMIEGFKKKLVGDYPDDFSDECVWC